MPHRRLTACAAAALLALALPCPVPAQEAGQEAGQAAGHGTPRRPGVDPSTGIAAAQVATGSHAMVASQEAQATRIGLDVLKAGGNAVDAAVAVGFALAVTLPRAGNIGGGGFMVVHAADRDENVAIDYRETAPTATTADVFLGPDGEADQAKSRDSGLGVGVPGTVAGLSLALSRFGSGKFALRDLVAPAVRLAREGVPVTGDLLDSLRSGAPRLARFAATARVFLKDGGAPAPGDTLIQDELAQVLERIGQEGPGAFYGGPVAGRIVQAVRGAGGRMTLEDLKDYAPVIRKPVTGTYRDFQVVSMPPPSSGGIHLVEMLNILEGYPSQLIGSRSPQALHLQIEAMKLAYADRALHLGDADAVAVPVDLLVSKRHADDLRRRIDPARATPSTEIGVPASGGNTTHFSVVDEAGNVVANTYSLNFNFGLGLVADGTGILLNNELDDFAAKAGAPNAFGLLGGAANAPGPGKRPLSSMSPTIVFRDHRPVLVTGAPGGSRIITTVLQVVVNALDGGMAVGDAVAAPRLHHQWWPDEVVAEPFFPPAALAELAAMGHKVTYGPLFGSANSIAAGPGTLTGAADLRAQGAAAAGY